MARLAALVPPPRMHLTRFHGVFAPRSKLRAVVTPANRGAGTANQPAADPTKPPTPRHVVMTWVRRLERVFGVEIEIERCVRCGGKLKIIASIEDPQVPPRSCPICSARYLAAGSAGQGLPTVGFGSP